MSRRLSVVCLVLAPFCWSFTAMIVKSVPWSSWAVTGWRSVFSGLFLWLAFRTLYPRQFRFDFSPANLAIALSYSAFTTLFAVSAKLTTAANAVLLQYSSVVYVAVLAPFLLREKTRGRDWLLILMTLGGLSLLILSSGHGGRGPSEALGILAGAGCGLCWGMCVIFMRRKGSESIPLSCLVIGNAITVIYSFPAMMDIPLISLPRNLALAAVLGIGPLGLGYVFYLSAIGKVTAMEASLIPAIEPLLNPIWAYLVLTETPSPWTVAGGVVVLMAVGLKAASALRAPPLTQASSS